MVSAPSDSGFDRSSADAPSRDGAHAVSLSDVWRSFASTAALAGISLEIAEGEFFSLLGPSGCGKSTLLRIVAGLDRPDRGDVRLHGVSALEVPAHRRPVNTVFQSYALFPHLSVGENIGFGLRMQGVDPATRQRRVEEAMALVRLEGVSRRAPEQLSGGQRQRVALARALVNRPRVLLLDEPLAALDRQLRVELQCELRSLQRQTGITFVLVTHDQDEALSLSDRVAVLRAGRVEQTGTPHDLYDRPRNRFVAEFVGACNVWTAQRIAGDSGGILVEAPVGVLRLSPAVTGGSDAQRLEVGIRLEQVELLRPRLGQADAGNLAGTVATVRFEGAASEVSVRVGSGVVRARCLRGAGLPDWREGEAATVRLPAERLFGWAAPS